MRRNLIGWRSDWRRDVSEYHLCWLKIVNIEEFYILCDLNQSRVRKYSLYYKLLEEYHEDYIQSHNGKTNWRTKKFKLKKYKKENIE